MAPSIARIRPRSPEELDAMLDECKAQANSEGHAVDIRMQLNPPRNKPCPFCDSGRKWKKCACREEDTFRFVFYPDGAIPEWAREKPKRSAVGAWATLAMVNTWMPKR